ncbi:DUF1173 domain-containing protein [Metapseudomonas lalkuanensis]|uniref:DUF1173 family protein n=1 Tax=Metapseudomonas lalkuanensis TaxID=2604832 RepID=UPI001CF0E6FC|nr:DUF1173 family protein [Pseudomonas lalkuanensis]UCP00194.1 DUF1173 domain-containing protein [Pseudomonas lalkuanensis]
MRNFAIKIASTGEVFPPSKQSDQAWFEALEKAHRTTHGLCLCLDNHQERRVSIRRKGKNLHLARFRNTSHLHHKKCRFYALSSEQTGLQGYTTDAVRDHEDGGLSIQLERGLTPPREADDRNPNLPATPRVRAPGERRNKISLGGLLHLLWSEASLNVWYSDQPSKRWDQKVGNALLRQAERFHVGHRTLDEAILLPAKKDEHEHQRNQSIVNNAYRSGLRLVAIGPLARFDYTRDEDLPQLRLGAPFGIPKLLLDEATRSALCRSYANELGAWQRGEKVYAIVQMALQAKNQKSFADVADVLDVSLLRLSARFIPLDSSYEGVLEQHLVDAGRSFTKPMKFDHNDAVFPDFWLLDMGCDYPVEVFGMNTPEYLQRKADKFDLYDNPKKYPKGWWYWDVLEHGEIPSLPTAEQDNAEHN